MSAYVKEQKVFDELNKRFVYHKPFGDQSERYGHIRSFTLELATLLVDSCPESRELSLALTKLEESVMWANASIARNEEEKAGE